MNKVKAIISPVVEEVGKFVDTAKEQVTLADSDQKSSDDTKKLVEDIYKPGETKPQKPQESDEVKTQRLRSELHSQYYQSLVNRPKSQEEPKADELERKKNEERWELQQKQKEKPPPLVVRNAQNIEKNRGSSG